MCAGAPGVDQVPYINGDGAAARDFCHIDNVVQANLLAATVEDPVALGQAYNIALGDQTTLTQLFDLIRDGVGLGFQNAGSDATDLHGPTFLCERATEEKSLHFNGRAPFGPGTHGR